jgi:hypothetical protein
MSIRLYETIGQLKFNLCDGTGHVEIGEFLFEGDPIVSSAVIEDILIELGEYLGELNEQIKEKNQ